MALGRGLDALLGSYNDTVSDTIRNISINLIDNNTAQPRTSFDDDKLAELSESIKTHGIVQPILLKKIGNRYKIIAGERRFRAAKLAGLTEIPAIIKDLSEREIQEVALIENLQRVDLNPIEEAAAIRELMTEYELTQEEIASRLGKSRPAIANALRLLSLPDKVQSLVKSGALSAGHARALAGLNDEAKAVELAEFIVNNKLSVRETEILVKREQEEESEDVPKRRERTRTRMSGDMLSAQERLAERFGTKVSLKGDEDKGKIVIEYYTKEGLMGLFDMLMAEN